MDPYLLRNRETHRRKERAVQRVAKPNTRNRLFKVQTK